MLHPIYLSHPKDRLVQFDQLNPSEQTWVVSDLKTKSSLQDRMLRRFDMIEDDSVLRMSELWRMIFFRHFPTWRPLSADLTKAIFQTWAESTEFECAHSNGAASEIFQVMQFLSPAFESAHSHEQIGDWFRLNPLSYLNWGEWYLVSRDFWMKMKERNWVPGSCMGPLLASVEDHLRWEKPLFLDVGAELMPFEAELIKKLSNQIDVYVLQPDFGESKLSQAYEILGMGKQKLKATRHVSSSSFEVKRFATSLSETKDCVHQVRQWVEIEGIDPQKIVIVAADPKPFERVLDFYMKEEGIPFSCDATSSLTDLPAFSDWLAAMSLALNPETEAIEQVLFHRSKKPVLDIDTFRRLYSNIYADSDLVRHEGVYRSIKDLLSEGDGLLGRDQFITHAMSLIPAETSLEKFESFLKSFLMDIPNDLSLPYSAWMSYLRARALRSEIRIGSQNSGVRLIKIDSFDDLDVERVYLLDLTEKSLKSRQIQRIDPSDVRKLYSDLGLPLAVEDPSINEWKVRWASMAIPESIYAVSSADWFGDPQSPSLLWLEKAVERGRSIEEIDKPRATVWDARQVHVRDGSHRGIDPEDFKALLNRLDIDSAKLPLEDFQFEPKHLSASGVEDYKKCPFIYAAKRVFGLADYSEIDIDIDPMTRGSLLHRAFEILLSREKELDQYSREELLDLLDKCAQDIQLKTKESAFWPAQRSVYLHTLERFLRFEFNWRKERPATKTIGRELEVSGFFDPLQNRFTKSESEGAVSFKGRVDRVDCGGSSDVFLIDYKSSSSGLVKLQKSKVSNVWSWIEKNKLQLVLYALALEAGLTSLGPVNTLGVAYFDFKKIDRRLGFRTEVPGSELFLEDDEYPQILDQDQKLELMNSVALIYGEVLAHIREGKFAPAPSDPDECNQCKWRTLCRASHLN